MAERVDISSLGGNEHDLNRTSVVFLKHNAPMHIAFNNHMMEGEWSDIKVVKDNGNSRPFLVVDHPELHAKVAIYLTSSINEARMNADNAIRGEHLFETPFALMSYISKSSVTGILDEGKKSVIDRDRFFFITDDWIDEKESRAKGYGEFKIGLNAHARNLREIDETLTKDLSRKNYLKIITENPAPELWVYRMGEQKPCSYHPSAQYLMLALNMMIQYKNERGNLSCKSLKEMGELAGRVAYVYGEYCAHFENLNKLELKNPKLYEAFIQTRYWNDQVTDRMEKNIRTSSKSSGLFSKPNSYKHLYGNPKFKEGALLDEIITQELLNVGIRETKKDAELKFSHRSKIKELLSSERNVYSMISDSTQEIVEFLNKINSEERINLSAYPYVEKFWTSFYDNYDKYQYIQQLSDDLVVKYRGLAVEKQNKTEQKRVGAKNEGETKKLAEKAKKQKIKERKEKLVLLEKKIKNSYIEQYFKAYKMYEQGKLLPIPVEELEEVSKFSVAGANSYNHLLLGAKLASKFRDEVIGMGKMSETFKSLVNMATIAEKQLSNEKGIKPEEELALLLMEKISEADTTIAKKNKKLSARERKPLLVKEIHEVLTSLPEEELDKFLDEKTMAKGEEVLKKLQDIYHARTTIRTYASLRDGKNDILRAIEELNDPKLIEDFKKSQEAIGELQSKGLVLPVGLDGLTIESINKELAHLTKVVSAKIPTKEDYKMIVDKVQDVTSKMRRFSSFSQKLISARSSFLVKLEVYKKQMSGVKEATLKELDALVKDYEEHVKEALTTPHEGEFTKVGDMWVAASNPDEKLTDKERQDIIDRYYENAKACLDSKNYINLKEDKLLVGALFDKLFPSPSAILADTRESVSNSKKIEDAIEKYKQAEKQLEQLLSEKDQFCGEVTDQFSDILCFTEDILENIENWRYIMGEIGKANIKHINSIGYPENVRKALEDGVNRGCNDRAKKVRNDFDQFRAKFRNRVDNIISAYPARTQIFEPMKQYLNKSALKSVTIDGVNMPKSILGNNGVAASIDKVSYIKRKHTTILAGMLHSDTSRYKDVDVQAVENYTLNTVKKIINEELTKAQREVVSADIVEMKESLRRYAKKDRACRDYVVSPSGLKKDLEWILSQRGKISQNVDTDIRVPGKKMMIEGEDYFNFYKELLTMLPDVIETLDKKEPYKVVVNGKAITCKTKRDWTFFFDIIRNKTVGQYDISNTFRKFKQVDFKIIMEHLEEE